MIWLKTFWGQGAECGGFKENDPHRHMEIGTNIKCGLVGVGVPLKEEVFYAQVITRMNTVAVCYL